MIIDGSECGSASEMLIMTKWHMLSCWNVAVFLCDTEIDDKDSVPQIMETHGDILQFDITMDIVVWVDVLKMWELWMS